MVHNLLKTDMGRSRLINNRFVCEKNAEKMYILIKTRDYWPFSKFPIRLLLLLLLYYIRLRSIAIVNVRGNEYVRIRTQTRREKRPTIRFRNSRGGVGETYPR